jgi:hypothetical protein
MQLLRSLPFFTLGVCRSCASAAQPDADFSVPHPPNDVIEINIQIDVGSSGLGGSNRTTHNMTRSSRRWESHSLVTGITTVTACEAGSSASIQNRTSWLPTAASQGIFTNSTSYPSTTGSFRTPSQVEFAPLFSDSNIMARIDMLLAWSVAGLLCVTSVLF